MGGFFYCRVMVCGGVAVWRSVMRLSDVLLNSVNIWRFVRLLFFYLEKSSYLCTRKNEV